MTRRPRPLTKRTQLSKVTLSQVNYLNTLEDSAHEVHQRDEEEETVDAPRVAQWIDEADLQEENEEQEGSRSNLRSLQRGISDLPLGALCKAQSILAYTEAESDDSDYEREESVEEISSSSKGKGKEKSGWGAGAPKTIAKRANKHAPIEVTSKRPVTRKRVAVDVSTLKPRDPRFLPLAGEFSATKFQQTYSFLVQRHQQELEQLRESLKRARNLLSSSSQDTLATEVQRLELAVKRAESLVNKDKRDAIENTVLAKMGKEEREKRKHGKRAWYFKKSNKREILMKARYEALASEGGTRAVKKAIEKRQRKIGQKEKKSRLYTEDGGRNKRRRVV